MATSTVIMLQVPTTPKTCGPSLKSRIVVPPTPMSTRVSTNDEEYEKAHERAFPPNAGPNPYSQVGIQLEINGYPRVLAIGASHITHWKTYSKPINSLDGGDKRLENFRFVGVGGARLDNMLDWIQGVKLPKKKKRLGNQWRRMLNNNYRPDFICLMIGSNTVDFADRKFKAILAKQNNFHAAQRAIEKEKSKIFAREYGNQSKIIEFIRYYFEHTRICYPYITPRPWWGMHARELASWLDFHMTRSIEAGMKVFKIPEMYIERRTTMSKLHGFKDDIVPGLLDSDDIHLNAMGYHVLTRSILVPLCLNLYV